MKRALIIAVLIATAAPPVASADESRAKAHQVLVGEGGGEFEVRLHPSIITSLFFPEPVRRVLASDQKNFTVRKLGNAVAVRPHAVNRALRANIVITTKTMRLTVLLRVTDDPKEAHAQVAFRKASVERDLQKRIDKEVKRRMAGERATLRKDVERAIAARVFARFGSSRLKAIERNDDNVIVMVPRVVRVGSDAYVFFRIHNRSSSSYQLAKVTVRAGKKDRTGPVVIDGKIALGPVLADVRPKQRVDALVVVRNAARLKTNRVSLVVSEPSNKRAVTVTGVKLR